MEPGSLLAVRLPNWVGDAVMAVPTLRQLQRVGFELRLLGRDWAQELLAGLHLPVQTAPRGVVATGRILRRLRAGQGLLLTNSLSSAAAMRLASMRAVGYRGDWRRYLLEASLRKHPGKHEVEHFWRVGELATRYWGPREAVWPELPPSEIDLPIANAHRVGAARALSQAGVTGPFLVCCPMSQGTVAGRAKRWPYYDRLCAALAGQGHTIVVCPGRGEMADCKQLLPHVRIIPNLSLATYAAVLARAEAVIANDSGPMHLAAAVKARVLGVFGASDPQRTRPWGWAGHFVGSGQSWPDLDAVLGGLDRLLQLARPQAAV